MVDGRPGGAVFRFRVLGFDCLTEFVEVIPAWPHGGAHGGEWFGGTGRDLHFLVASNFLGHLASFFIQSLQRFA